MLLVMDESKILSKKNVFQSKYFYINQIEVKRGNKQFSKDVIIRNNVVLIIPLTETDEVYLISEYRDAYEKNLLEVIGGNMDEDHSPLENAKRELKEETGITAKLWQQVAVWDISANIVGKIYVFLARNLVIGTAQPDEDEMISLVKMPFDKALESIMHNEITVAHNIAGLYLAQRLRENGFADL